MSSIDDYLAPTKRLCNIIGMWPKIEDEEVARGFRGSFLTLRKFFALVAIGNIVLPEIFAIIESRDGLATVTRVGCVLITVALVVFKMIYLIVKSEELARLYLEIRGFWGAGKSDEELKVYAAYAKRAKIFTVIFFVAGFGNNVTFTSAALFGWVKYLNDQSTARRNLPFEVWYGFDIESSPNYEITFILQTISAVICCVGVVGLDSMMMSLVLHLSGQFALLKYWFQYDIGPFTLKNEPFPVRDIKRYLQHHQKIIEVADQLEALLNPVVFAQLITSAAEICLSGYAVTTGIGETMDLVRFANYLISLIVQLFSWCIVGEILMQESAAVGDAAFHDFPWYRFPVYLQRDFILVIKRSQKPCCLTAAKFQTINAEKLGDVFSAALSYFTLLRQMRNE